MLYNTRHYNEMDIFLVKLEAEGRILSGSVTDKIIETEQVTVDGYQEGSSFDLDFDNIGF